ncbi:MAG: PEP-CTERM/exosortase system-associated acyltransferase [Congregibacter sp.]
MRTLEQNLYAIFFRQFELGLVISPEQHDQAAKLRHRVFSEECGYEPVTLSGRESDVYDQHSLHCVIYHRRTGIPASCIRLILPARETRMAMEDLCEERIHLRYVQHIRDRRDRVCEVSRFAVDPAFRRTSYDESGEFLDSCGLEFSALERQSFGLLSTVALLSALAMAHLSGRHYMFSLMEAKTPRLVRRSTGVNFEQAGEPLEHRGQRVPFCLTAKGAVEQMRPDVAPLYHSISSMLAEDMQHGSAQPKYAGMAKVRRI